jgi:hypothetical protein
MRLNLAQGPAESEMGTVVFPADSAINQGMRASLDHE